MMSTRSGKRIHSSISENVETVSEIQTERKTRSKRVKENNGEVATDKKKNFVRLPFADEVECASESVRKSRRHTLKALNIPSVDNEALNDRKSMRHSRRTQKEDTIEPINMFLQETNDVCKKKKKKKKKRTEVENLENVPVEAVNITKKKNIKKKRKSNSFIVEELVTVEHTGDKSFNKSNVSVDSFHSAAGSPGNYKDNLKIDQGVGKNKDIKESSTLTSHHSVKNVKDTKKRTKKTEKDSYLETLINKSVKLSASNESFELSVNKVEKNEDNDVNTFEKGISGAIRTKSKQKKSKERNSTCDSILIHSNSIHGMEFQNSIEANTHSTNLKKKTIEENKIMNTSTSNVDFTNIPQVEGTVYGLESVSPSNNCLKKKRKSTSKNSTSDKIDTSITPLNSCNQEISETIIETNIKLNEISINHTAGSERKSKSQDATNEKISWCDTNLDQTFDKTNSSFNRSSNKLSQNNRSFRRESSIKNTTYDKSDDNIVDLDSTFNKNLSNSCNTKANSTINKSRGSSRVSFKQDIVSTILNGTYNKSSNDDSSSFCNNTYDKPKLDTTFERTKDDLDGDNLINLNSKQSILNADNMDNMTSDMSEECSRISITSDDSRTDNIVNTTPLLIESSMDEPQMTSASILLNKTTTPQKKDALAKIITPDKQGGPSELDKTELKREETFSETKTTPLKRDGTYTELRKTPSKQRSTLTENENPTPTLKREGTFTKESPDVTSPKSKTVDRTPTRRKSMPSPGRTPFPSSGSGSVRRVPLNVTHSIEKPQRRSSIAAAPPRLTKVMFRSPVDDPVAVTQMKGKLIKSNLKGSSKSFMFDEKASERCGSRKRSRTQGCADDGAKRARTAVRDARTHIADADARAVGRARTASAAARLQAPVEAEVSCKSDAKPRTKLPDFAALHRKQFMKMESLDECQRRHARRARALLTPTARLTPSALPTPSAPQTPTAPLTPVAPPTPASSLTPIAPRGALHRNNPKGSSDTAQSQAAKKPVTQKSKDIDKKTQSYTRFGFKLNLDVNPFSIPAKTSDTHPQDVIKPKRQATLPSLAGTTLRKEAARHAVMREKSFTEKRDVHRTQNRTVIKGVRTNRRFELQMKMRNID